MSQPKDPERPVGEDVISTAKPAKREPWGHLLAKALEAAPQPPPEGTSDGLRTRAYVEWGTLRSSWGETVH